jgi:hypothetical protein
LVYRVNLGWAGTYKVEIKETPTAYREDKSDSSANPFIGAFHSLCVGNMKETYNRCFHNKNYLDCAIIINQTLSCKDDSHGYRGQQWRNIQ